MKFNLKFGQPVKQILNYENAPAFELTPEMELYSAVVTSSLSNQFYESGAERIERLRYLIQKNDPLFVAKLAIYVRENMHLRSMPMVLAVELGKQHSGDGLIGNLTNRIVQRSDEITEMLAYYSLANSRMEVKKLNKLSKQLQKGLSAAFNKFDEYQFAKYNRDAVVKLKDALFLVHPKAKDENQQALFDKIVGDKLTVPYTWETELSALGQIKFDTADLKREAIKQKWEELIFSNKLGYMATLRNLRNILEAEVNKEALNKVCGFLSDAESVAKSKQLPFRFLAAYLEMKDVKDGRTGKLMEALEEAVSKSAQNLVGFDENTKVVIAADVSGSMQKTISPKSKVQFYDIGLMLAMILKSKSKNAITGMFGDTWKIINVPGKQVLSNVQEFRKREGEVGYSTNGYLVIKDLLQRKQVIDKIILFTDCQLWNSNTNAESIADLWKLYKRFAPNARLYLFDMAGLGKSPLEILKNDVYLIAGWSDKIFDVLAVVEAGSNAIEIINQVEL
jgi:60 kDa SS-A/Ro ribonucleoprotein